MEPIITKSGSAPLLQYLIERLWKVERQVIDLRREMQDLQTTPETAWPYK